MDSICLSFSFSLGSARARLDAMDDLGRISCLAQAMPLVVSRRFALFWRRHVMHVAVGDGLPRDGACELAREPGSPVPSLIAEGEMPVSFAWRRCQTLNFFKAPPHHTPVAQ